MNATNKIVDTFTTAVIEALQHKNGSEHSIARFHENPGSDVRERNNAAHKNRSRGEDPNRCHHYRITYGA